MKPGSRLLQPLRHWTQPDVRAETVLTTSLLTACCVSLIVVACAGVGSRIPEGFPKDLLIKELRITDGDVLLDVKEQVMLMMVEGELFDSYEWNKDHERLLAYYRTRGFVNASLKEAEAVREEDGVRIWYTVDPGDPVIIRTLALHSSGVVNASRLLEIFGVGIGDRLDRYALEQGKNRINAALESRGYVYTDIQLSTEAEGTMGIVRIGITEGPLTYVGDVSFAGLRGLEESIARRYLALKPGSRLLPRDVQRTQRYLLSTGLFNSVRILVPGMDRGEDTLKVFVNVREAPFRFVEAGLGYVYPGRIASSIAVGHQNVHGMAASLRLDAGIEGGWVGNRWQRTETAALSYHEPWFRALPIGAGTTVDTKRKTESASSYQSIGANIQVSRSWYDRASVFVRYQYRYRETEISGSDTTEFLLEEIERPITNSIAGTITLDSRDSFTEPHTGHLARLLVQHAGDFLGGDWSFRKVFADWSIYHDTGPAVVAFRARLGVIRPLSGSPTAPDEERFRAGGANTVRGFDEEGLGPRDGDTPLGGEALALGNIEARIPLRGPLHVGVFFDIGQVWGQLRSARVRDLEPAMGFGFRYRTIIGPVRADWGIPLRESRKGHVYLTLGHAF